ncbi:MAG: NAD(P)-binding domain-containing protein [Clostridia bacterium]|nr:NAD(P)-binding domain-containing protein [Clostridia bacterium]
MKIGIIGTGAFGIALSKVLSSFNEVIMWSKFEEEKEELAKYRENKKYFPGITIDETVKFTTDLRALRQTEIVIIAVPFIAIRELVLNKELWFENQIICSTTKGIDEEEFKTTTQILEEGLNTRRVTAITGPTFAIDVAIGQNVHMMLGYLQEADAEAIYNLFKGTNIKLHKTIDLNGIQIAGVLKNAIAIGSGILEGLNSSNSVKASYVTNALQELSSIIENLGFDSKTAYTYAGIGDLILTCTSENSRNFTFGKLIGQNYSVLQAFEKMGSKTVEGYKIIEVLHNKFNFELINTLYDIIYLGADKEKLEKII